MAKCPLSGKSCPHRKIIHVTEIQDYQAVEEIHCCHICGDSILNPPKPEPEQKPSEMTQQTVSLFEILKTMIHSKFNMIPDQMVITNIAPESFPLTKPPCPSCGSSLYDIHKSQRLGCPECYKHYKNELLPVLVHAHKSCEHVGKSPKQCEITSNEEKIKMLNLKFKQGIEQENYEKCAEIKKELENLNKNTPPQQ